MHATYDATNYVECRTCKRETLITTDGNGKLVGYDDGHRHPCEVV